MTKKDGEPAKVIPIKKVRCPVCRKAAEVKWQPFCSKRCADIDLGRWLNESYRIPTREEADQDGFPEED
jgi:endogenous inhibitor of DNA gyrase (YacG/DUF329 family)